MGHVEHYLQMDESEANSQPECVQAKNLFKMHSLRVQQQDILVTILHLSRFIQRHRGATLALLGGDKSFHSQVETLQKQTSFQFEYLQCLNKSAQHALDENDYQQLVLSWLTIIKDWENDDIHHSFEFHSHLLELILRLCRQLADAVLGAPPQISDQAALTARVHNLYLQPLSTLSQTCVIELYELTEYLARIRGLGTHMAAMGQANEEWESRVGFWLQEFSYRKERFDQNLKVLPSHYLPYITGLKQLPNLNMKLNYFINLLSHEMTAQRTFQVPSHKLFLMGTEIIDGFLTVMDQANAVIRDQLYHMNQMLIERLSADLTEISEH